MSLVFCDGFDDGLTAAKWDFWSLYEIVTTPVRNGGKALHLYGLGNYIRKRLPVADQHREHYLPPGNLVLVLDRYRLPGHQHLGENWGDCGLNPQSILAVNGGSGYLALARVS